MLETITFGYSEMKIWPMLAAIAKPDATNAQPSLSVAVSAGAKITAITPKIWVGCGSVPPPITTSVQMHHATLTTTATTPMTDRRRGPGRGSRRWSAATGTWRRGAGTSTSMFTPVISP